MHISSRFCRSLVAATSIIGSACASHHAAPDIDAVDIASVRAHLRLVNAETTWVADGNGYELIGRSRAEIAAFQPALDRLSATLRRVFPKDSFPHITATIRRLATTGTSHFGPAPVPAETREAIVELPLPARERRDEDQQAHGSGIIASTHERVRPVLRAWLSAHASKISGSPAHYSELTGEADDPRVPAWAFEMLSVLGDSISTDRLTHMLAANPENLIPLADYFTMQRPAFAELAQGREGRNGSGDRGEGGGGRSEGMGGRAGMGRRGGMSGGRRGGSGEGSDKQRTTPPLRGLLLFTAQSAALGQYLTREGYDFVGQLADTQITGKPVEELLTLRGLGDFPKLESDWHYWVTQHGATVGR